MSQIEAFVGVWKPESMAASSTEVYDTLVFHKDGTGFLEFFSPATPYLREYFRWSLNPPGEWRLLGARLHRYNAHGTEIVDWPSTLNAVVSFSVRAELTSWGRRTQVLRMGTCPWSGLVDPSCAANERYQAHEMIYATFQAPYFVREEEASDSEFRGKALLAHLAKRLRARGVPVGKMQRIYLGACYYRVVEVGGQSLGLSVNWDWDLQAWWLRVSPPMIGGKAEAEELCDMLTEVLGSVAGLHNLEWHEGEGDLQELYSVTFTNMSDPSAEPAAGQYHLRATWAAASEAHALEQALPWAIGFNNRAGLPPYGMHVGAEELRRQATVMPCNDVSLKGYVAAFDERRGQCQE